MRLFFILDDLIVLQTNGLAGTLGHGSYLPADFAEEINNCFANCLIFSGTVCTFMLRLWIVKMNLSPKNENMN